MKLLTANRSIQVLQGKGKETVNTIKIVEEEVDNDSKVIFVIEEKDEEKQYDK